MQSLTAPNKSNAKRFSLIAENFDLIFFFIQALSTRHLTIRWLEVTNYTSSFLSIFQLLPTVSEIYSAFIITNLAAVCHALQILTLLYVFWFDAFLNQIAKSPAIRVTPRSSTLRDSSDAKILEIREGNFRNHVWCTRCHIRAAFTQPRSFDCNYRIHAGKKHSPYLYKQQHAHSSSKPPTPHCTHAVHAAAAGRPGVKEAKGPTRWPVGQH